MDARAEKPRLFLTRRIPEPGMVLIREAFDVTGGEEDRPLERDALLRGAAGAEVLLCLLTETIDGAVMDAAGPSLRVISNMAVGVDNIDVAAATARGILVTNTPGVLTDATADLAWALILSTVRRVVEGDSMVREGRFQRWSPFMLLGRSVAGATLGIVGMGRIGQAVARRAAGWDMKVIYTRASGPLPAAQAPAGAPGAAGAAAPSVTGAGIGAAPAAAWQYRVSLDDLLREADIVSLHVPLTADTRHLIGARELALMKPGAYLINTARGPVVDEVALVEALRGGHLGGAGLDVYEREPELAPGLVALPNAVLLPHLGSATVETRGRMAELAALNAIAAVRGEPVPHPVNPEVLNWGAARAGAVATAGAVTTGASVPTGARAAGGRS
jgi:glyoxylate reductase